MIIQAAVAANPIFGAFATKAKISPAVHPAIGRVSTHEKKHQANNFQFKALILPLQRPTPAVAPVIQCVVEIGKPSFDAVNTVREVPNSMEKPRDGE